MNWSRAKTILIILFLLADLFLLVNLVTSTYKSTAVTPEIIASTKQILKNQGIKIDTSLIPANVNPAPYAEADNVITDYDAFSKLFLGENFVKTGDFLYESNIGTLSFTGDSFSFEAKSSPDNTILDEKSAQSAVLTFLKGKGFDLSKAELYSEKTADGFTIILKNTVNSLPLFNSVITATVSRNNVVKLSGSWFNHIGVKGAVNELKTVTSILIDFIPMVTATPTEITGLEIGYIVPDSSIYHKSAVLIPVWQITEANGLQHYPDARNPE